MSSIPLIVNAITEMIWQNGMPSGRMAVHCIRWCHQETLIDSCTAKKSQKQPSVELCKRLHGNDLYFGGDAYF